MPFPNNVCWNMDTLYLSASASQQYGIHDAVKKYKI